MNTPKRLMFTLLIMALAVTVLSAPVLATDPTTEVRIVKFADDGKTILNETTVDYHWMEANLPIYGDGVTRYYMEGPVFEGVWESVHPNDTYDPWDTNEDVQLAFLKKGDFGAVMGTNVADLCDYIGGASPGDTIKVYASDGWARAYPYSQIYDPDPRQGPAVLCWYSGNGSGPDAQSPQGQGYPDTGYDVGMRMIFFADTSTNPWGWHAFGNNDMRECWNETYWNKGGTYWSVVGTSPKWVDEIRIYSQESAVAPVANFTTNVTSGETPLAVAFTDTSTNTPTSWSWTFGDGATSDEQNPVHTYTAAGTYDVTLTVANSIGSDTATASVTVIGGSVEPGTNSTLTLLPGWNFVSTPKRLAAGQNAAAVFGGVDTAGHSVLLYDGPNGWKTLAATDTLQPLDGIWIYANGTYDIPLVFAAGSVQTPPTKDLYAGWNAIGFSDTVSESAANTLRSVKSSWTTVFGFNATSQAYDVSIINGAEGRHAETREMLPMQGYWVYMSDADTLCAIGA